MKKVFNFLRNYSTNPKDVDRLIISAFLTKNALTIKRNKFLKSYVIDAGNIQECTSLVQFLAIVNEEIKDFDIEKLIELFEFVISPADRVINGAVYTPLNIREFIIDKSFEAKEDILHRVKIADISCGCGGFLYTAAKQLKLETNSTYFHIFKYQIFGIDIQPYSIVRTKLLLCILALKAGEDKKEYDFNLYEADTLTFKWKKHIKKFLGFDIIVGNPPYVAAKHLTVETKAKLETWEVCKNSGNPDLYIPFFQIGIESLKPNGILGVITMNSFFKSLNGRSLRAYFQKNKYNFKILDFGGEQVFKSKNTYTCICLIEKNNSDFIEYVRCDSDNIFKAHEQYEHLLYASLNSKMGWNMQDPEIIKQIESVGRPFGELYTTRHGIATLKNDIFIFKPVKSDKSYHYLQNGSLYPIEKGICKDIVNSNKLSRTAVTLNELKEKVIFPYDNSANPTALDGVLLKKKYPKAYKYLEDKRSVLEKRDKGEGDYQKWFAFGRTQSLEKVKNKMFFPKISDKTPTFIINEDEDLLFYNGCAIIGGTQKELLYIKKLMESRLFWYYITKTSKPYSSKYYSLNGNYINNFGVCDLSEDEMEYVLKEENKTALDSFFERKYDIKIQ